MNFQSRTRGRTTHRCPHCKVIYHHDFLNGDIVHECSTPQADAALQQEDVVIVGNWTDYSGSGSRGPTEVMLAGVENELDISAKVEGARFTKLTPRGKRASTHRQRNKQTYIEEPNAH